MSSDKLEKIKKEEKEKEKEMTQKIRDLKIKRSTTRRENVSNMKQPPMKRRKVGEQEFKRVEINKLFKCGQIHQLD